MPEGEESTVPVPGPAFVTVNGNVSFAKLAVTVFASSIVTVQEPAPAQAPLQPVKDEVAFGVAVSVTVEPTVNGALQLPPQSIPVGLLVTEPPPLPLFDTVSTGIMNVAVTYFGASVVTVQEDIPVQSPLQPVKAEPEAGAEFSVTETPAPKYAEQVAPQSIPEGKEDTVPAPVPALVTVNVPSAKSNESKDCPARTRRTCMAPGLVKLPVLPSRKSTFHAASEPLASTDADQKCDAGVFGKIAALVDGK